MKVAFSKDFEKAARKQSGKILQSLIKALDEVRAASSVSELTDCKKIESLHNVYRLRIGDRRAFFVLHILIEGDLAKFEPFQSWRGLRQEKHGKAQRQRRLTALRIKHRSPRFKR